MLRAFGVLTALILAGCSKDVVSVGGRDAGGMDVGNRFDASANLDATAIDATAIDAGNLRQDVGAALDATTFPDASFADAAAPDAEAVDAGNEDPAWEDILDNRVGFGRNARGGQGGAVCWVENLDNSGTGSLRACVTGSVPVWIRFRVSGRIRLSSRIDIDSYTTIDGRGEDVTIERYGVRISDKQHVIIHNIKFDDGAGNDEDAIQIRDDSQHIWIDHVSLSRFTDGLLDITRGATDITVSWTKFFDHDKTMLISANTSHTMDTNIRVTLHHNWFTETNQRHPRLRFGRVHAFNNYFHHWGSYAMGASHRSQLRSERNIFEPDSDYRGIVTQVGSDPDRGEVRTDEDWRVVVNGFRAILLERNRNNVFDPSTSYSYTADTADAALRSRIQNSAGWENVALP